MKIAVRAGHNYGVPGAVGYVDEVTENRKYAAALISYLRKRGHVVLDVTPTTTSTSIQDLYYGVSRANAWGAKLFLSCHINAGGGQGCEAIYYLGSKAGLNYANQISKIISTLGFKNRGPKADTRGLYELARTNMTAIVIEPFFLDTKSDVDLYKKIGPDKLGKTIASVI